MSTAASASDSAAPRLPAGDQMPDGDQLLAAGQLPAGDQLPAAGNAPPVDPAPVAGQLSNPAQMPDGGLALDAEPPLVRTEALPDEILAARRSIDNIDGAIVYLLAERFRLTTRIGIIKALEGIPAVDPGRERWQTERLTRIAQEAGLDVAFAEAFRSFVTAEVIRHHHHYAGLTSK